MLELEGAVGRPTMRLVEARLEKLLRSNRNKDYEQECSAELIYCKVLANTTQPRINVAWRSLKISI